tara:strand:+ start:23266 stop:23511 length:246 start_codon:yes stop_codon:yes gene_type:complete
MSECDKAKIVGYIEQTPEQIEMINNLKRREIDLAAFADCFLEGMGHETKMGCDKRWMAIAKTHFEQGFMAAVRAIARPRGD